MSSPRRARVNVVHKASSCPNGIHRTESSSYCFVYPISSRTIHGLDQISQTSKEDDRNPVDNSDLLKQTLLEKCYELHMFCS